MAVAPAQVRAPDIILRTAPPLEATSDQPLIDAARPPEAASNDPADHAAGTPKEATAEELAAATAARRGAPPDVDPKAKPEETPAADPKPGEGEEAPKLEFEAIPDGLPGYAIREITKHRKQAQAKADAAWEAAKANVGDAAWTKALKIAKDAEVEAAQKDAKTARDALDAKSRELEELRAKAPPVEEEKPAEDPRPSRDGYDDPDLYDTDLEAWAVREGERKATAKVAEEKAAADEAERIKTETEAKEARDAEIAQMNTEWSEARTAAIEKYPDYAEVAEASPEDGGPDISGAMAAAIIQSGNGTEVAYYLGQNTDEALRISKIPNPYKQILEIGKISERLANPARRAAPPKPPIEPIDGGEQVADTSDVEEDMETYYNKRTAALTKNKHPFYPPSNLH